MDITNHTPYTAAYNVGLLPSGRHCVVVVIKATYHITDTGLEVAEEQQSLQDTDAYTGEPGASSLLYDNDFAPYKPRCDVLLHNPTAYAPNGQPVTAVEVALHVGACAKKFRVIGPRVWQRGLLVSTPSPAQPFTQQPLSWEIAYGGTDHTAYPEPERSAAYTPNPVGLGYWHKTKAKHVWDTPVAQTEDLAYPIKDCSAHYPPQGFGPIARNWQARSQYAGTYDDHWAQHNKPFLPDDFDEQFYQVAPPDQQIAYPTGGENITLRNLNPTGYLHFNLPQLDVPVILKLNRGTEALSPQVDTLTLDPTAEWLTLVARAHHPLRNNIHEVQETIVGQPPAKPVEVPFYGLQNPKPSATQE